MHVKQLLRLQNSADVHGRGGDISLTDPNCE